MRCSPSTDRSVVPVWGWSGSHAQRSACRALRSSTSVGREADDTTLLYVFARQAQGPASRLQIELLHVGVVPGFGGVSEGRIEHAPLAVHLGPGYREIAILAIDV